jgi:CysZ protein
MFASARKALAVIFDPAFSGIVARAILFTLVLFIGLLLGAEYGVQKLSEHWDVVKWGWLKTTLEVIAPVLAVVAIFYLGAPVAAIFASLYLDRIAEAVEAKYYPADGKAPGTPFFTALRTGSRLALTVVLVDIALLPLDIEVPLLGEAAVLLVNGWLLGREYFELAALRHLSPSAAAALRRRHRGGVFFVGLVISILSIIPLANLFAPLFGSAFMVHQFKRYFHDMRPA